MSRCSPRIGTGLLDGDVAREFLSEVVAAQTKGLDGR